MRPRFFLEVGVFRGTTSTRVAQLFDTEPSLKAQLRLEQGGHQRMLRMEMECREAVVIKALIALEHNRDLRSIVIPDSPDRVRAIASLLRGDADGPEQPRKWLAHWMLVIAQAADHNEYVLPMLEADSNQRSEQPIQCHASAAFTMRVDDQAQRYHVGGGDRRALCALHVSLSGLAAC